MPLPLAVSRRGGGGVVEEEEDESGRHDVSSSDEEGEYELQDIRDRIKSSRGSRFNLIANEFGLASTIRNFSRENLVNGIKDLSKGLVIHPDNWY
ncbi:hypothetical protein PanWU01x14_274260 [Parasponia andersonii]|uniref:Uncharacterized protein n=1 Tax=Parasponia andersonii TaxID=3476 RepID=A0A2P5B3P2_PARAD|nr:hypothetical protein PanWU01x14_274260 [Parasponia andersonii]